MTAPSLLSLEAAELSRLMRLRRLRESKDDTGHEHAPAGSIKGGQFTGGSGGGAANSAHTELDDWHKLPKDERKKQRGSVIKKVARDALAKPIEKLKANREQAVDALAESASISKVKASKLIDKGIERLHREAVSSLADDIHYELGGLASPFNNSEDRAELIKKVADGIEKKATIGAEDIRDAFHDAFVDDLTERWEERFSDRFEEENPEGATPAQREEWYQKYRRESTAGREALSSKIHASLKAAFLPDDKQVGVRESKDDTGHEHKGKGPGGGQFTGGSGGSSGGEVKISTKAYADKTKYIGASVGANEHAHADAISNQVAKWLGGKVEEEVGGPGQSDKKPFDVRVKAGKDSFHDVEVKSLLKRTKQDISVHDDALLRKVNHVKENPKNDFHTVVVDERNTYEGGNYAEHYSGHRIYYKRGSGRYKLKDMHQVKDEKELRKLLATPDDQLPEAARGQLPPPPPLSQLEKTAAQASESRKKRDKIRKEKNKDKLREQARARAQMKREAKMG